MKTGINPAYSDDVRMFLGNVDEHGKPVERTKMQYIKL